MRTTVSAVAAKIFYTAIAAFMMTFLIGFWLFNAIIPRLTSLALDVASMIKRLYSFDE